jgi:hypothetical protein
VQTNSISGWANFTADVRCKEDWHRREVLQLLRQRLGALCQHRGVNCSVEQTHDAAAVGGAGALAVRGGGATDFAGAAVSAGVWVLSAGFWVLGAMQVLSDPGVVAGLSRAVTAAQPLLDALLPYKGPEAGPGAVGGGGSVAGAVGAGVCRGGMDCEAPGARSVVGQQEVPEMLSGAGHDAMAMADLTKASGWWGVAMGVGRGLGGRKRGRMAGESAGRRTGGRAAGQTLYVGVAVGEAWGAALAWPGAGLERATQRVCPEQQSFVLRAAHACGLWVQVGMVFVRSLNGGVSHTPLEHTSSEDIAAAAAALATFLEQEALGAAAGAPGEGPAADAGSGRDEL